MAARAVKDRGAAQGTVLKGAGVRNAVCVA